MSSKIIGNVVGAFVGLTLVGAVIGALTEERSVFASNWIPRVIPQIVYTPPPPITMVVTNPARWRKHRKRRGANRANKVRSRR